MPKDFLFSTDNFNQPKVVEGKEAISTLLVRLILLEPGTNQVRPEMGVGLVSRYRYIDKENISDLKQDIYDQITRFMPQFQDVNVNVSFKKNSIDDKDIIIDIRIDDTVYRYETKDQKDAGIGLINLV